MDRSRHKKSKSFSGIEGIQLSYRPKSESRLSSDSSRSYVDGRSKEEMFVRDLGKSPVRQRAETSMKRLLAEEMTIDLESKKRRGSVFGRLMGLESSASSKRASRQQKRPTGSCHQQSVLVGRQRSREPHDSVSNRSRSSVDHQEFKDVYEDLEASHLENRHSSRWSASSMLTKAERALIQQKFIDAKLLSTNQNFQDSKELDDALEMLDSNRDLLLRFLQEPNNLHDHSSSSSGSQIAVLRPNSTKYKSNCKAQNLQQDTYLKRKDSLLLEPQHRSGTYVSRKASNTQLEEKNGEWNLPTQIVILKPSRRQSSSVSGLSPDQGLGFSEMGSCRENEFSRNVGLSRPMTVEAREIARRIARRMRSNDETFDTKSTILRGYAGDESSYSESDSDYESEKLNLLHNKSFGNLKAHRYPSPHVAESSVNMEGKQRLSERWKTTQRYQDLEMIGKGSTLGEMLSIHENEIRPKKISAKTSGDNGSGDGYGPYCISSRDGWKDETRTSTRSRSVPPSIRGKSQKKSTHHNGSIEDKHLLCSDHNHSGRIKVGKEKLSHGGDSSLKDSISRSKKPFSYQHSFNNGKDSISGANFEIKMEANVKDLSERKPNFQIAEGDETSLSPVSDVEIIAEHESKILSSKSHEIHEGECTLHDSGNSSLQEPNEELSEQTSLVKSGVGGEPGSLRKPKEANRSSPVSVHEATFAEDLSSSSEGFERLGAELHDLRMKLRLLKMESGTYTETSTSLPPTEDHTHSEVNQYHFSAVQDWEISYTLDILQESGIEDSIFDTFKSKWHSPGCPLDVKLFDELENIYNDDEDTAGTRSERKLLFDRTNLAISEIWQQNADLFPWVKPKLTWLSSIKANDIVGVVLEKVMIDGEPYAMLPGELDKDMQWSDCKEEIDAVGNELEKMLVDEMILEVFM